LGILLVLLLVTPPRTAGDSLGVRRFLTPEVGTKFRLTQLFVMDDPDLSGIELRAAAVGPVRGHLMFTLRDVDTGIEVSAGVPAADVVRDASYLFAFPPIELSSGHEFRLDVVSPPGDAGSGVAFWATKGERLDYGGLSINGTPRWASLAFQTHTPAVAPVRAMFGPRDPQRPPRWLAAIGLSGAWLALRFVLKAMVASADEPLLAR
jgi:hypothetical protein